MSSPVQYPSTPWSKYRFVVPVIMLVILGGVTAPFVLAKLKHGELQVNETATLELIHAYQRAQDEAFKAHGAYATRFDALNLPAPFPDIDDVKTPALKGYRFRILTEGSDGSWLDAKGQLEKDFGLLAVPADYMMTGRDTFLIKGHAIYVVDLNVRTAQLTRDMRVFQLPADAQQVE